MATLSKPSRLKLLKIICLLHLAQLKLLSSVPISAQPAPLPNTTCSKLEAAINPCVLLMWMLLPKASCMLKLKITLCRVWSGNSRKILTQLCLALKLRPCLMVKLAITATLESITCSKTTLVMNLNSLQILTSLLNRNCTSKTTTIICLSLMKL